MKSAINSGSPVCTGVAGNRQSSTPDKCQKPFTAALWMVMSLSVVSHKMFDSGYKPSSEVSKWLIRLTKSQRSCRASSNKAEEILWNIIFDIKENLTNTAQGTLQIDEVHFTIVEYSSANNTEVFQFLANSRFYYFFNNRKFMMNPLRRSRLHKIYHR